MYLEFDRNAQEMPGSFMTYPGSAVVLEVGSQQDAEDVVQSMYFEVRFLRGTFGYLTL